MKIIKPILIALAMVLAIPISPSPSHQKESNYKKTIFVTIPKAGTHLLKKAITLITKGRTRWIGFDQTRDFNPKADLLTNSISGIHIYPEVDIVRTQYPDDYTKVLLIRDPRDIMISFMNHLYRKLSWAKCDRFDHDQFKELSLDERLRETLLYPDICFNPMTCFQVSLEWIRDPTVFVCRFEDLIGSRGGGSDEKQQEVIRSLAIHLGFPLKEERILSICNEIFGGTWTFFKGQIGAWKTDMSEENKRLFKMLAGQYVIDYGYETDNNW